MAVKKSKPAEAAKKAPSKAVAEKAEKPKKASAAKATKATPAVASNTASKAETPKPASPSKAPAAPKKAPAAVKLTDRQLGFLKQVQDAKEAGYLALKKAEHKTLEALLDRKLIKKGAKDKTSGAFRYTVSKAGEKHLSALPPA